MADDLKLLVPWSFWYIPLKDRTSFQKEIQRFSEPETWHGPG